MNHRFTHSIPYEKRPLFNFRLRYRLSPEYFNRAVKLFSNYLTFLVTHKHAPDSPVISTTLTLDILRKYLTAPGDEFF